jgi:hypothetical protein
LAEISHLEFNSSRLCAKNVVPCLTSLPKLALCDLRDCEFHEEDDDVVWIERLKQLKQLPRLELRL